MEKRPSDEPAALRRKKRRRKVVESSSEDQEEQVDVKKTEETVAKPSPVVCDESKQAIESASIPDDETLGIEPRSDGVGGPQRGAMPDAEPETEPKEQSEVPPAEVPQVAEPAQPATESARKRDNATKVLHAARAWLRAPVRKNDALMLERCAAMSGLTKKEIADFVEANVKRKPGEWCFTVVDERIGAKKKEEEAIQVATGATSAPLNSQVSQPEAEELLPSAGAAASNAPLPSAPSQNRRGKRAGEHVSADGVDVDIDGSGKDAVALSCANSKTFPEAEKKESQESSEQTGQPAEEDKKPVPMQRRRGPKPRAPKSSSSRAPPAEPPELSCLEATSSSGRRKFAPLRPGTRSVQSSATLTAVEAEQPKPIRKGCRHPNVSKNGCAMVCDLCGEVLLYDGWRLELCDEFDVYNSATN